MLCPTDNVLLKYMLRNVSYTFTILVLTQHKVISYKEIRLTGKNSWSGKGEKCSLFSSFNPQNQSNWINQTTLKQLNKGVGTQHKEGISSYNSSCGLAFWLDTLWNISYNQELRNIIVICYGLFDYGKFGVK